MNEYYTFDDDKLLDLIEQDLQEIESILDKIKKEIVIMDSENDPQVKQKHRDNIKKKLDSANSIKKDKDMKIAYCGEYSFKEELENSNALSDDELDTEMNIFDKNIQEIIKSMEEDMEEMRNTKDYKKKEEINKINDRKMKASEKLIAVYERLSEELNKRCKKSSINYYFAIFIFIVVPIISLLVYKMFIKK